MGTKKTAIVTILSLVALSASAQGIGDAPFQASTRAPLTLRADAPHWWSITLPDDIGILERGATVRVLNEKKFGTLFGKETWFQVEVECNPDPRSPDTPLNGTTGWVFGGRTGEFLQRTPSGDG